MANGRARQIIFRIFYSTSFTIVFLLLLAHIVLTPADTVYQSYKASRIFDIFVIAGIYFLTALLAILIYASRLFTTRSALKDIPKTFMPIEKEDLPRKQVYKIIFGALARSAVIAYNARPRIDSDETFANTPSPSASLRIEALKSSVVTPAQIRPDPSLISHPGWSSPTSTDLGHLQYSVVIAELPDLIEAKAVSLAPTDPPGGSMPSPLAMSLLQRPPSMGMRPYFTHLTSLGVIESTDLGAKFLHLYEQARFSADPVHDRDFRALMSMFAEILRGMQALDPDLLDELQDEDEAADNGADNGADNVDMRSEGRSSGHGDSASDDDENEDAGSVRRKHVHYEPSSSGAPTPSHQQMSDDSAALSMPTSEDSASASAPIDTAVSFDAGSQLPPNTEQLTMTIPANEQSSKSDSSRKRPSLAARAASAKSWRSLHRAKSSLSAYSHASARSGAASSVIHLARPEEDGSTGDAGGGEGAGENRGVKELPYKIER